MSKVSDEQFLTMIGLDGYMLMRYITICCRIGSFFSFWGLVVLLPVYHNAPGHLTGWDSFTLANIPDDPNANELWAPAVFCYLFSAFFCQMMYNEYKNFINKRVQYLEKGDLDTPTQTYYTVMVEKVPTSIKSAPMLHEFFESLFPVEVALDLHELEELTHKRREIRNKLEKSIAISKATGHRPTMWVAVDFYVDVANHPVPVLRNWCASLVGFDVLDSVEHYSKVLEMLNDNVESLQKVYYEQRQKLDEMEEFRLSEMRRSVRIPVAFSDLLSNSRKPFNTAENRCASESKEEWPVDVQQRSTTDQSASTSHAKPKSSRVLDLGARIVGSSVGGFAKEGIKTAALATKGALRGVLEATRTLELLTVGAYYKTSTTAFVTFKSRVSVCSSQQMLLSHEHYAVEIKSAPNPKDILWENVSIPQRQINMRKSIADSTLIVGALFWSIVVAFITAVSNLESISQEFPQIQAYRDTEIYKFLNNYLAIGVLLILLALLPAVFDFISRHYEGVKLESEIQNSIMTRYFYYQLANVFVSVGLGSVATSLHEILNNPSSVLSILGQSLPSFSIYFTNLIVVKTFTAVPVELLRLFPLVDILSVKLCIDKKKCTRRELRTGAFADPPILYGWIYPNLLMVLMIMVTYSCIAPLLMPFCTLYFAFAHLMYKYQLLYVYINEYQSGGFMWYAVFNRSMVALICGVSTLLCYLAIRKTFVSGPFYLLFPLPFMISYFWYDCERRFKTPALNLSLEGAIKIDKSVAHNAGASRPDPLQSFNPSLFRQPSLAEGRLRPSSYRKATDKTSAFKKSLPAVTLREDCTNGGIAHVGGEESDGESAEEVSVEVEREVSALLDTSEQDVTDALAELYRPSPRTNNSGECEMSVFRDENQRLLLDEENQVYGSTENGKSATGLRI